MNSSSTEKSSLPIYYSKSGLTIRFADYSNVFVLPVLAFFGICTNLVNIVVTMRVKTRDNIIKYIITNSVLDFLFLLTQVFIFIMRCGTLCPYGFSFWAKCYEMYVFQTTGYVLITFQAIYNLYLAFEKLKVFAKNLTAQRSKSRLGFKTRLLVFLTISALMNVPFYLIAREINLFGILRNNQTMTDEFLYQRRTRTFGGNKIIATCLSGFLLLKGPVFYVLIGIIDVLIAIKFRKFIENKKKVLKKPRRNILFLCVLFGI